MILGPVTRPAHILEVAKLPVTAQKMLTDLYQLFSCLAVNSSARRNQWRKSYLNGVLTGTKEERKSSKCHIIRSIRTTGGYWNPEELFLTHPHG
jgi:hypothetical protein